MRLIDADKLAERIKDWGKSFYDFNVALALGCLMDEPTVDQWHYPSKGEYPTDDRRVLCKLKGVEDWYECGGYDRDNDEWNFECINLPGSSILAWQYIVPPKEVKDERG